MIKIMFICYGNICRSPMAEFMMKDYVRKMGKEKEFFIASSATSTEEIGNGVHRGTRGILDRLGIDYSAKRAVRLTSQDYDKYDYFIGMDYDNLRTMKYMLGGDPKNKCSLLLDYTNRPGEVADPWYTHNFEDTYRDVKAGIEGLYKFLTEKKQNT